MIWELAKESLTDMVNRVIWELVRTHLSIFEYIGQQDDLGVGKCITD